MAAVHTSAVLLKSQRLPTSLLLLAYVAEHNVLVASGVLLTLLSLLPLTLLWAMLLLPFRFPAFAVVLTAVDDTGVPAVAAGPAAVHVPLVFPKFLASMLLLVSLLLYLTSFLLHGIFTGSGVPAVGVS